MDPFTGTIVVLGSAALAALVAIVFMSIFGFEDSVSIIAAVVTWMIWILFWRAEVVLPTVLAGGVNPDFILTGWWLLWTLGYITIFLIWFRIWFKRWI